MTLNVLFYSDICDVNLSFGDWLDGLQKTVENATKQESSSASKGLETINLINGDYLLHFSFNNAFSKNIIINIVSVQLTIFHMRLFSLSLSFL